MYCFYEPSVRFAFRHVIAFAVTYVFRDVFKLLLRYL